MFSLFRLNLLYLFLVSSSLAAVSPTNAPPGRLISLQESIDLALKNNLDLKIERINPAISLADVDIARAGYDPVFNFSGRHSYGVSGGGIRTDNVVVPPSKAESDTFSSGITGTGLFGLSYNLSGTVNESYGTRPEAFDTSSGSVGISLTQPLLRNFLFDPTRYNIIIAKKNLSISELRLRQQIMTVINSVEQAYYELIFARENVKVQETALQLAQQLFEDNKRRVEIGTLAPLDEKQAESQVSGRQTDVTVALRTLATQQNALKKLITAQYRELHDEQLQPAESLSAVPVDIDLQESWGKGLAQRPDLLQSRLDLERQGITVKYFKNQLLPQLDLTGSYGYGASGDLHEFSDAFGDIRRTDKPSYSVGTVFSVPLGNKSARERYKQGKFQADQLLLQLKKLEEGILVQIDEDVNQVRSSLSRVESTRQSRAYAEAALQAEQQKLNLGRSTSFVVLQLQRDVTAARSDEIRALADYNKALSQLSLDEGATLERNKINVEVK
jgi:outer membrane protein TolC